MSEYVSPNRRYNLNLIRAMNNLARMPDTIFIGQAVKYAGTGMFDSLIDIDDDKKMEFPCLLWL